MDQQHSHSSQNSQDSQSSQGSQGSQDSQSSQGSQYSQSSRFTQTFFLSAGETNAEQEISLPLLTSKIIDIATAHANSLGIGNPAMEAKGCGWVLSRIAIEMERYPRVNETYSLTTWVEAWNRHFSVRNFMVADGNGKPVGYATSVWMVLNTVTRENAGLSHLSLAPDMIDGSPCPIARPGKHPVIVPEGQEGEIARGAMKATAPAVEYKFAYCDLDFYRHVNTVRYVSMVLNQFTLAEMDATQVARLELAFMREGRYGETVTLLRADKESQTAFSIADSSDGAALVGAVVVRRPRS